MISSRPDQSVFFSVPVGKNTQTLFYVLLISLVAAVSSRFFVVFNNEINWDEFYYLSQVYEFGAGTLDKALQTIHVRFFGWLAAVSGNEAEQIIAARLVMLVFQIITGWFIYKTALLFLSRNASLFSVFCYFSFSYVIWQGTSFRTDPVATCLLMAGLYYLAAYPKSLRYAVLAGGVIGLAGMVTIKSVFFVPVFSVVILSHMVCAGRSWHRPFVYGMVAGLFALGLFVLLYLWHKSGMAAASVEKSGTMVSGSVAKTIGFSEAARVYSYFIYSLPRNIVFWSFVAGGIITALALVRSGSRDTRCQAVIVLSFLLPLLSVLFYRNSFPYYFTFILAPATIFCGLGWDYIASRKYRTAPVFLVVAILAGLVNIAAHGLIRPHIKTLDDQKLVLSVIHELFPEPVPYIDRCGMVSRYPKAGFFMSTWGLEKYRGIQKPVLVEQIEEKQPVFILANARGHLDVHKESYASFVKNGYELMPEDLQALRDNYMHFWGPIYVAGKTFDFGNEGGQMSFSMAIEGIYTIETQGGGAVFLDGVAHEAGDVLFLKKGVHTIAAGEGVSPVSLIWGRKLQRPQIPPPQRLLFSGF